MPILGLIVIISIAKRPLCIGADCNLRANESNLFPKEVIIGVNIWLTENDFPVRLRPVAEGWQSG